MATVHPSQREAGPFRVVMAGRLGLEDDGVKQARLAVEAVARASTDPSVRHLGWRMQLVGARHGPDQAIDDATYRAIWDRHVSRHRPLIVEAFDPDRERLLNSLRDADLVLMPSLREGFGLVGWEAIAAGTPLVASTDSGLYKFLERIGRVGNVTPVDIHGLGAGRGEVDDADVARLIEAIVKVASNRAAMKWQALRLAEDLRADPARSWAGTAAAFMDALKIPRSFGELIRDMKLRQTAEPQLIVSTRVATLNVQPIGRDAELAKLAGLWPSFSAEPAADRVGVVVGAPGLGKSTVLAAAARKILISDDPPSVAMFWSFADQAGEGGGSQARSLLDWLLASFGRLPNTPLSDAQRIDLAVELLEARRALLILDGLDAVQFPPGHPKEGNVSDTAVEALINQLGTTSPGLLLLGTRLSPKDLAGISESRTIRLKPLGLEAGAELLRERGLGDEQRTLEAYVKRLGGSRISLELFAGYVTERAAGELRAIDSFLDAAGDLPEVEDLLRATMEQWFESPTSPDPAALQAIRCVALFDRPVTPRVVEVVRRRRIADVSAAVAHAATFQAAVSRLRAAGLISANEPELDLHPIVRSWIETDLERRSIAGFQAAHERLYKVGERYGDQLLRGTGRLDGLYACLRHGVRAGLPQRVSDCTYGPKIREHNNNRAAAILGLVGEELEALGYFYRRRYQQLAPGRPKEGLIDRTKAWILNETNSLLYAQGRVREAAPLQEEVLERMRVLPEARRDRASPPPFWGPPGMDQKDMRPQLSTACKKLGEITALVKDLQSGRTLLVEAVDVAIEAGSRTKEVEAQASLAWIEHAAGNRAKATAALRFAVRACLQAPPQHLGREAAGLLATPFVANILEEDKLAELVIAADLDPRSTSLRNRALAGVAVLHLAFATSPQFAKMGQDAVQQWFGISFDARADRFIGDTLDETDRLLRRSGHLTAAIPYGFQAGLIYRKAAALGGDESCHESAVEREADARRLAERFGTSLLSRFPSADL